MSITTDPDAQDRADMARLQAGQDDALNDLMARHATPVFHFLCRLTGNEDDANDLAQETFVRVYKACRSFRPDGKFSTWLFTIAANLARNHSRWRSRHPNLSLEAENGETGLSLASTLPANAPPPSEAALAAERAAAVRQAVLTARRPAGSHRIMRMGGTQRGGRRHHPWRHRQSRGITAIPRPPVAPRTAEKLAVGAGSKSNIPPIKGRFPRLAPPPENREIFRQASGVLGD